ARSPPTTLRHCVPASPNATASTCSAGPERRPALMLLPGAAQSGSDGRQQDLGEALVGRGVEAGGVHRDERPARAHEVEVEILLHRSTAGVHRRDRLERGGLIADPTE